MYTIMYSVCTWNLQAQKKIMIVMASPPKSYII